MVGAQVWSGVAGGRRVAGGRGRWFGRRGRGSRYSRTEPEPSVLEQVGFLTGSGKLFCQNRTDGTNMRFGSGSSKILAGTEKSRPNVNSLIYSVGLYNFKDNLVFRN